MNKKIITVLLTILTVMLLTGCNAEQKAVTESAEGFLNALVNNDMEAASQFATEDFMNSETMKLMDPQYLADGFYASMKINKEDLDEEAQKAVDEYVKNVVDRAYKSYEIQDIKIQENQASVTTRITLGYDPDASAKVPDKTFDLIEEYRSEHYDELIELYVNEGEKAMYRKLYSDLIPIVIGEMQAQLDTNATSEEKTILNLEKRDDKWLVTSLEEKRVTAAEGNTGSEEASEAASTAESAEYARTGSTASEYASEDITSDWYEQASEDSTSDEYAAEESTSEESADAGTTEGETGE